MMHYCSTSDGARIVCLCQRGADHDEEHFDLPPGTEPPPRDEAET